MDKVHRRYRTDYFKYIYDRNARSVYGYLVEHPCVDCSESDPIVLDFDHVRGKKTKGVKRFLAGTYSLKRIFEEIDKCEVRCANCHRRATAARNEFHRFTRTEPIARPIKRRAARCGSRTRYRYHGCRCVKCKLANAQYSKRYRKLW